MFASLSRVYCMSVSWLVVRNVYYACVANAVIGLGNSFSETPVLISFFVFNDFPFHPSNVFLLELLKQRHYSIPAAFYFLSKCQLKAVVYDLLRAFGWDQVHDRFEWVTATQTLAVGSSGGDIREARTTTCKNGVT